MKRNSYIIIVIILVTLFSSLFAQERLTILHWNDFHSCNTPYYTKSKEDKIQVGGYATLAGYINSIRSQSKNVALVNAGDDFQGTPISAVTKGFSQIEILNIIKPDVFTLGNHEFDYGKEKLYQAITKAKFPIISANIFDKGTGKLFVKPYLIKKYGNITVGFIGLQTANLKELSLPENVRQLEILNPEQVVRKYTSVIKDSVDIIVIVSHQGLDDDKKLAAAESGFQIIIGGHSHTALFEPLKINDVVICQAGSKGKYLGVLDLFIDIKEKKIVNYKSRLIKTVVDSISPDFLVRNKVDSLEQELSAVFDEVIGVLKNDWINIFRVESNVGNWEADVMREYAGTDFAFQNSGGIRKNISAGNITIRDMWELNPFSNHFVTFEVTGIELRKVIEKNCDGEGEFLHVSGLKYVFNKSKPVGNRVVNIVMKKGELIKDNSTYTVCTNNFLTNHFYGVFGISPEGRQIKHLPKLDRDVFIESVKKQKVIESFVEGRMVSED